MILEGDHVLLRDAVHEFTRLAIAQRRTGKVRGGRLLLVKVQMCSHVGDQGVGEVRRRRDESTVLFRCLNVTEGVQRALVCPRGLIVGCDGIELPHEAVDLR